MSASNNNARSVPIGELNILSSSTPKGHRTAVDKWDEYEFVKIQNKLFADNGHNKAYPSYLEA